MTFHEMKDILDEKNIPLENLIYRLLYSYSLIYIRYGNKIPAQSHLSYFTHDATRGCLFDMNGVKRDVIYSTNKPQLCSSCIHNMTAEKVPVNKIIIVQNELLRINKSV